MFVMTYAMEERKHDKKVRNVKAVIAVVATAAAAVIGSLATDTNSPWYNSLTLSPLQPPAIVFPIVWTVLYIMIAAAFALAILGGRATSGTTAGFVINLILNAFWSIAFFQMHNPMLALVVIVAMLVNLIVLLVNLKYTRRTSMFLMLPYLIWLCSATILNISIIVLN